jgi:hypothetical protein
MTPTKEVVSSRADERATGTYPAEHRDGEGRSKWPGPLP